MKALSKVSVGVPAVVFIGMGLAWWVAPGTASQMLGMPLLTGAGLSSQIADLASFFLTLGGSMLIGLISGNRTWFLPPILLLGLAIVGRWVAWLAHGADFAARMVAVEAFVLTILVIHGRAPGGSKR